MDLPYDYPPTELHIIEDVSSHLGAPLGPFSPERKGPIPARQAQEPWELSPLALTTPRPLDKGPAS
jgi:hypothetical protein